MKMLRAALSGCIATLPMSLVMLAGRRFLRAPLPPRQITNQAIDALHLGVKQHEAEHHALTIAAHFGYGTAAGALYAPLENQPGHPVLKGALFGLGVWLVSYLGWIPAANIMPPATQHSAWRNMVMISAHLVWGAALGVLSQRFSGEPQA